jgi:hypothetical protein
MPAGCRRTSAGAPTWPTTSRRRWCFTGRSARSGSSTATEPHPSGALRCSARTARDDSSRAGWFLFPPHIRPPGVRQSPEPPALHMRAAWFELALAAVAPWCRDERGSGVGGGSRGYLTRAAGARLGVPGMSRLVGANERGRGACRPYLSHGSRRSSCSTAPTAPSGSSGLSLLALIPPTRRQAAQEKVPRTGSTRPL